MEQEEKETKEKSEEEIEKKEEKINEKEFSGAKVVNFGDIFNVRIFTQDEINEINGYVKTQIPQSEIAQLLVLSENPMKKVKIFITIYRILTGVRDFIEKQETREKMNKMLGEVKKIYNNLYQNYIDFENAQTLSKKEFLRSDILEEVVMNNTTINKFCNNFLVFAEKQELTPIEEVSGVNLEKDEGEDVYKKIQKIRL